MSTPLEGLAGALAGRYRIEREIGHGGMAIVYLAHDLKHDRQVAIKVLRPEIGAALGTDRFLREITIAAQLHHPHILPLYDSGEGGGFLYYVMPFIEGESLRSRMDRETQLPLADAVQIAREVADALSYAHIRDVVHRDIKPENILLESGHAVVADFGIARAITAAGGEKLTETGIAVGTPTYMSPEQASAEHRLDGRSDVYTLGCVLYEMLAGHPPFAGRTAQELLARHSLDAVPLLSAARPGVPPSVEQAIGKALAKVPADRYRTAQEFSDALLDTQSAGGSRWRVFAVSGLVLLALGAVVWRYVAPRSVASRSAIRSITVIPVKSLEADSSSVVLAEALSLALNTQIGQLGGIEVKGHLSAARYRNQEGADVVIARELGVDGVLHTTFLRYRDSVQVHAQLFDAAGIMVLAHQYDYGLANILRLSSDVARDIAQGIEVGLTREERRRLAATPAVNPAAYEQYAWGHLLWTQRGEGLKRSLAYFQRAIALDSGFADAWAGLADAYNMLGFYDLMRPTQAFPLGRAAAEVALRLDPSNARAHTALGAIHGWYDLDQEASLREFETAIQSNPGYWIAYAWRAPLLQVLGRPDEAVASGKQAIEGDRYYPITHMALGWRDYVAGDFKQAEQRFRRILDLTPDSPVAHRLLGQTLTEMGRYPEAEAELRTALANPGHSSSVEAQLAYLLARTGRTDSARAILSGLNRRFQGQARDTTIQAYVSALDIAIAHTGLGQVDSAITWLDHAFQEKDGELFLFPVEPRFNSLRADPRFSRLLGRYWAASASH